MASHAAQPNRLLLWGRRVLHLPGRATDDFGADDARANEFDRSDPAPPPPAVRDTD
jgi:hypothetical protein